METYEHHEFGPEMLSPKTPPEPATSIPGLDAPLVHFEDEHTRLLKEGLVRINAAREREDAKPEPAAEQPETSRFERAGEHLHRRASELGWKDDGEGAFEFITRTHYEAGLRDGAKPADDDLALARSMDDPSYQELVEEPEEQ